jgi:hypothetical protein
MEIVREAVELLLRRLHSTDRTSRQKFDSIISACISAPDSSTSWSELDSFFRQILALSCIENPQELYEAFRLEIDACRTNANRRNRLTGASVREIAECKELERQLRELQNAKIALTHDLAFLKEYQRYQSELFDPKSETDAVNERSARVVRDLLRLSDSLNEELRESPA